MKIKKKKRMHYLYSGHWRMKLLLYAWTLEEPVTSNGCYSSYRWLGETNNKGKGHLTIRTIKQLDKFGNGIPYSDL